jgi:hypothetical protein
VPEGITRVEPRIRKCFTSLPFSLPRNIPTNHSHPHRAQRSIHARTSTPVTIHLCVHSHIDTHLVASCILLASCSDLSPKTPSESPLGEPVRPLPSRPRASRVRTSRLSETESRSTLTVGVYLNKLAREGSIVHRSRRSQIPPRGTCR